MLQDVPAVISEPSSGTRDVHRKSETEYFIYNMYYSAIKYCDIANGTGVRTTLFVSGCRNHCEGCFQPDTWNFCNGNPYTAEIEKQILDSIEPYYVSGLTLLGGDPFEEENQEGLIELLRKFKAAYPEKDVWAFTGYLYDELLPGGRKHTEYTDEMLSLIDILVDGPFVMDLKNLRLKFRGSSNQRIIDMNKTRAEGQIVLSELNNKV